MKNLSISLKKRKKDSLALSPKKENKDTKKTKTHKKILRISREFVSEYNKWIKDNKLKHAGRCVYLSRYLKNTIKKDTGKNVDVFLFWDTHAAVVVGDLVIDPTAKQFDNSIEGLFYKQKQEYLYWLSGTLFMRGKKVLYDSWETLITKQHIRKI